MWGFPSSKWPWSVLKMDVSTLWRTLGVLKLYRGILMNQASPADFGLPLPGLAGSVFFSLPLFLFLRLVGSRSSSSKRMCLPFRFNLNDRLGGPAAVKAYVRRDSYICRNLSKCISMSCKSVYKYELLGTEFQEWVLKEQQIDISSPDVQQKSPGLRIPGWALRYLRSWCRDLISSPFGER